MGWAPTTEDLADLSGVEESDEGDDNARASPRAVSEDSSCESQQEEEKEGEEECSDAT